MAFLAPESGNSLFQQLHSLFSRVYSDSGNSLFGNSLFGMLIHMFDRALIFAEAIFCGLFVFCVFHVLVFLFFDFLTQNLYAHFCSFFHRNWPRECHHRILREKLYRVHQFSSKLAPGERVL